MANLIRSIPKTFSRPGTAIFALLMVAILGGGLFLRLDGLARVQHFQGDQGRDYIEVMRWIKDGHWPLLGPQRITGDNTLGPGWYYTLAPALALSGFNPVAGAATMAAASMLAALLAALWVRRATGSRLAAAAVAAAWAGSMMWMYDGRTLWNPNVLPLGTVAMALLIQRMRRAPGSSLAMTLMLMAILPQWHTTGFLVMLAAAPSVALAYARARRRTRRPEQRRALWIGLTAAAIALLYLPPLIYELKPGRSNLKGYFSRTAIPSAPTTEGPGRRLVGAFERVAISAGLQTYYLPAWRDAPGRVGGAAAALALLTAALAAARLRRRRVDFAVYYLALLAGGYTVLLALKGAAIQDYFLIAMQPAPLLLGGWTAGMLLRKTRSAQGGTRRKIMHLGRRALGAALVAASLALTAAQLPAAWAFHKKGNWDYGDNLERTRAVAAWIAGDSGGEPYSLDLAHAGDYAAHYLYLVRLLGRPAKNTDYLAHGVARRQLGRWLYVIDEADPEHTNPLVKSGVAEERTHIGKVAIYRIPAERLPLGKRGVRLLCTGNGPWTLKAWR